MNVVSKNLTIDGIANAGTLSISLNAPPAAPSWHIVFTFTSFTPTPEMTIIQLTLLEGEYTEPGSQATSLQQFLNGPAQNCNPQQDDLFFFFKDNNTTSSATIMTQEYHTTVRYTANQVIIDMPITSPKLNWTNNGDGNEGRLCQNKPGGIYLATRMYTQVRRVVLHIDLSPSQQGYF